MSFAEMNKISESIDTGNQVEDSGQMVAPEPENQVGNNVVGLQSLTDSNENEEQISPVQKRINQLTAQKKDAQEENNSLKQEIAMLRQQVEGIAPKQEQKDPEPTLEDLKQIYKEAYDEGNVDLQLAIVEEMQKITVRNEKEKILKEQKEQNDKASAVSNEWNMLINEFGKYGLDNKDSEFFKLAKTYYETDTSLTQTQSVMKAFKGMFEDGALESIKIKQKDQQIAKERSKMALGGGDLSPSSNINQVKASDEQYDSDYIKSLIKGHQKKTGFQL